MYIGLHVKCEFFVTYQYILIFSTNLRKVTKYQIAWKSVQREQSCSTRTGGRTGGKTKATNNRFSKFCESV